MVFSGILKVRFIRFMISECVLKMLCFLQSDAKAYRFLHNFEYEGVLVFWCKVSET